MKVVIMAGGKGTRIATVNSEVPKPMIKILDKPILQYQIESMVKQGFTDILIVIGYKGEYIKEYFGNGKKFNANIDYFEESSPLGTAGALYYFKDKIKNDFLLVNGDIIFDINIKKFYNAHKKSNGVATLFTHPNSHPYDSGIIVADNNGKVLNWLHKEDERTWYKNRVNAGIHFFSPKVFDCIKEPKKLDLDRDVLKPMIQKNALFIYDSPEYVKDMGTPDRYNEVIDDIVCKKVQKKNLLNKQKCIFLDRDGTINKYVGFLRELDEFELLPKVSDAIKLINKSGYLAIVVTNQPVIARGEVSINKLDEIHNKMETLLGEEGAYLDDVFYCPHHPTKGFQGELEKYKISCDCRKPKPGLLIQAAKKYNINLNESIMIGDSLVDVQAGESVGCKSYKLDEKNNLYSVVKNILKED